jgi:hypothetical protein
VPSWLKNIPLSSGTRPFITFITLVAETSAGILSVPAFSAAQSLIAEPIAVSPTRPGWIRAVVIPSCCLR